jgi:hypothetical protein
MKPGVQKESAALIKNLSAVHVLRLMYRAGYGVFPEFEM